jgi:glycosyltransferase involved in cell wall biosynthesis
MASRLPIGSDSRKTSSEPPGRLAFVTSTPLSVAGGSGTYVGISQLARSLDALQVCVETYAPTFRCPSVTLKRLLFNLGVARRLRRSPCDWVVGFDLDGFHYGRAPQAPYVASLKGVIADEMQNERGLVRLLLGIQAGWERLAVRRAAVVVATSRYSCGRIVEAYGISAAKVVIVPELIDLRAWGFGWDEPAAGAAEPPAVLTVAHMYPRKNLELLLHAYARLAEAGVPFQGWVVGEGPCRRAWERLRNRLSLANHVQFLGTIPRQELLDRYRRAAVFCLPSRQEGFGIVFLEAMACGKPIVAAHAAAVPETVTDGKVGILVDPNDPDDLARALARLLGDAGLRQGMGAAGRRRVEQYRADRVAAMFLAAVGEALLRSAGTRPASPAGGERTRALEGGGAPATGGAR